MMKLGIAILIFAAFLQTTILPVNLVLLILVLRSFLVNETSNLYLACGFGLLISHLNATPLGIQSMVYLSLIIFTRALGRLPISNNILVVIPLMFCASLFDSAVNAFIMHASLQIMPAVLPPTILAIPAYIIIRFWEERFVVRDIKLKVK